MKILLNNIKYFLKNNVLYLKNIYFCKIFIPKFLIISIKDNFLIIKNLKKENCILNTFTSNLKNLILGIKNLWIKKLEISGIGYKFILKKNFLIGFIGYSNPIQIIIPSYIKININKNNIIILSVYKDKLGVFAEKLTKIKKYDPYKKKGIFFLDKCFIKKSSKKKQ
ncbi:50S ribosomal protein L6 [Candidatus Carsonella ruddii]|uniref:50S ribosomal protein L6 n=1 Tax=Candidatus Carsonella ruddii PC isolate NHV TaxID=1202540 RepID=J3TWN5_CARRU|nr:50S ribosomal protein L6 [Candidatus Carsonella ruddii]AFP84370.1 ribosomal protein L6 [Candidatus Carsonella ruddii PC isolate NHV]